MSDTKNVKLGVCKVFYGGVDLGYTQGGVDVTVKTETHKVNVDQFGKTTINEVILSRDVTAKTPLAETTLENLVKIMPGAVLTEVGGSAATGTITIDETYTPTDTDNDGDLDGLFALGTDQGAVRGKGLISLVSVAQDHERRVHKNTTSTRPGAQGSSKK